MATRIVTQASLHEFATPRFSADRDVLHRKRRNYATNAERNVCYRRLAVCRAAREASHRPPAAAISFCSLRNCFSRPSQRGLCGPGDVPRPELQRSRFWPGRWHFLHRILPIRNTRSADRGALERAQVDCENPGELGIGYDRHGGGAHTTPVLCGSIPAWSCGSRLFPGYRRLSHPLVSLRRSRQSGSDLYGGDSHVQHHWIAPRRMDSQSALGGYCELEMAIRGGGGSSNFVRDSNAYLSHGLAATSAVAGWG